jgi:hypothetical protein
VFCPGFPGRISFQKLGEYIQQEDCDFSRNQSGIDEMSLLLLTLKGI